jgi:hypothetical protein
VFVITNFALSLFATPGGAEVGAGGLAGRSTIGSGAMTTKPAGRLQSIRGLPELIVVVTEDRGLPELEVVAED